MAAGDILAAEVQADGAFLVITVAGVSTGGTYAHGLGANGDTSTAKVALSITSTGYDDTGGVISVSRTVYNTQTKNALVPSETTPDETVVGSDVKIRIALTDYVYAGETITAAILGGLYTQGGTPSAASLAQAVTNSSTATHQKVVTNWTMVPKQRVTGNTFRVRAVAFHRHGEQGRPVRAVKFIATDAHSHTAEAWVTAPAVDSTMTGDQVKVCEYFADLDVSAFTNLDDLTLNLEAYPWVGDSGAVQKTATSGYSQPTPHPAPLTFLIDKAGTYGVTVAVVSSAGNDGTGAVVDSVSFNAGSPPAAFATIGGAANAIRAYNQTNRSRTDIGGGVIYLRAGSHAFIGASGTFGTTPKTWCTITTFPGDAQAVIGSQSVATKLTSAGLLKIDNVEISSTAVTFNDTGAWLWFNDCRLNSSGSTVVNATTLWWVTGGSVPLFTQGLRAFSTNNTSLVLARGLDLTGFTKTIQVYTVVGCRKPDSGTSVLFLNDFAGMGCPHPDQTILAFCTSYGWNTTASSQVSFWGNFGNTIGGAIVGVILEQRIDSPTSIFEAAASEATSTNTPVNNLILANCTVVGAKINIAYNSAVIVRKERKYWRTILCIFDDINIKGQDFDDPTFGKSATRDGNLEYQYHVGFEGCYIAEVTGVGGAGSFNGHVPGRFTVHRDTTTEAASVVAFVDRKSWTGSAAGAGGGDYHLQAGSPARSLGTTLRYLPVDINGHAWSRPFPGALSDIPVPGNASGTLPTVTISAPGGTAAGASPSTGVGSIGTVTVSAPESGATGSAAVSGVLSTVTVSAPTATASGATSGLDGSASGVFPVVSVTGFDGVSTGTAVAFGDLPTIGVVAPTAVTRRVPRFFVSVPAFDFRKVF